MYVSLKFHELPQIWYGRTFKSCDFRQHLFMLCKVTPTPLSYINLLAGTYSIFWKTQFHLFTELVRPLKIFQWQRKQTTDSISINQIMSNGQIIYTNSITAVYQLFAHVLINNPGLPCCFKPDQGKVARAMGLALKQHSLTPIYLRFPVL